MFKTTASVFLLSLFLVSFFDSEPKGSLIIRDKADYVEINHIYRKDEKTGKNIKRMIQLVWWEWKDPLLLPEKNLDGTWTGSWYRGADFVVKDFRVTHTGDALNILSIINPRRYGRKWICEFYDVGDRVYRKVICGWSVESHTLYDSEVENRTILQIGLRTKLTSPHRNKN